MRTNRTDLETMIGSLTKSLGSIIPSLEIGVKAALAVEVNQLKKERNAIILGHNYMEPALYHSVTDFKGDSLELAKFGTSVEQETIVFCGVSFMAETAKILSPEKTVLLPAKKAGCSLAESITGDDVRALKKKYPGVPVVSYVNTFADVKAETDVCCTSGNAAKVVSSFKNQSVIFLPDEYLAKNVARETGKHIIFPTKTPTSVVRDDEIDRVLIGWHGKCEVHDKFTVTDIEDVRKQFPDVVVLAHPECPPEVVLASDFSGSTAKMIRYVKEMNVPRYLLLTECSMADNIISENPGKDVLRLCSHRCPHMAQITLENTRDSLLYNQFKVVIPEDIRSKAFNSLSRMIECFS